MKLAFLAPLAALALVGCGGIGAISIPLGAGTPAATGAPQDLNAAAGAAPTTAVEATTLPPPAGATGTATAAATTTTTTAPANAGGQPPNLATQPATVPTAETAAIGAITVNDMVGSWSVRLGSDLCTLNFSFTDWIALPDASRAYRASTRACTADALRNVAGFTVQGQDVVLVAADTTTLARLTATGVTRDGTFIVSGRFVGQSSAGMAIEFFR